MDVGCVHTSRESRSAEVVDRIPTRRVPARLSKKSIKVEISERGIATKSPGYISSYISYISRQARASSQALKTPLWAVRTMESS